MFRIFLYVKKAVWWPGASKIKMVVEMRIGDEVE